MVTEGQSLRRLFSLLPLLLLLVLGTRAIELASNWPAELTSANALQFVATAALSDLLATLRYFPLIALLLWSAFHVLGSRFRSFTVLAVFLALLVTQALLAQYRVTAGIPLGADLFGYSWHDIRQTLGGTHPDPRIWLPLTAVAVLTGWRAIRRSKANAGQVPRPVLAALVLASLASWGAWATGWSGTESAGSEHLRSLRPNALAYFVDDVLRKGLALLASPRIVAAEDPYPFLHDETTPDALGPLFDLPSRPPDLVLIIVEGLGRSYSGPDARLGSFTPFLDSLAEEGLYWDNFISPQGRTFAVLPSLLGSMPFGDHGVLDMQPPLPRHANLPELLKRIGYQTRFFSGFDAAFDNERNYLEATGFDRIIDRGRIPTAGAIANEWGYDDDLLFQVALSTPNDSAQPTFDVIQTISTHDPFRVPSQANWNSRVDERLAELRINGDRMAMYRSHREVFASILFADNALRKYFEAVRRDPARAHTIFLITGDHRLPEIPMDERLERYHVPLLIWSPMLHASQRIKAVSSHFDVLPSLAALMATRYGMARPTRTTWLGGGLQLSPDFRMERQIPLKQTKVEPEEWLADGMYLSQVGSWRLRDGLRQDVVVADEARGRLTAGLDRFKAANAVFARTRRLQPEDGTARVSDAMPDSASVRSTQLSIHDVRVRKGPSDQAILEFVLENHGDQQALLAAPLAVVVDERGGEHGESYGQAVALAPREHLVLQLSVNMAGLGAERHFVSIFPSDPDTGHRIGEGQFKVPLDNSH